jgi:hypothetical protein
MIYCNSSHASVQEDCNRFIEPDVRTATFHVSHRTQLENQGKENMTAHPKSYVDAVWMA